jgi:DNA-binding winged helix-turn-helix (wHTH) protein
MLRLDENGLLWRGLQWVALSPVEIRLMACLLENVHRVVGRSELDAAGWPDGSPSLRALDTRLARLRRRIAGLGVEVASIRQRGFLLSYVLEG